MHVQERCLSATGTSVQTPAPGLDSDVEQKLRESPRRQTLPRREPARQRKPAQQDVAAAALRVSPQGVAAMAGIPAVAVGAKW